MFSTSSPANLRIVGAEGHNADTLRQEVARGTKFVIYSYNFSLLVLSFKRPSNIYLVRAGENRILKGLPFTLISLLFGWWGIPWGIIYTFQSLATNLGGGDDVTDALMASLAPAASPAATAASTTGPSEPTSAVPVRRSRGGLAAVGLVAALASIIYLSVCLYRGTQLPVALVAGTDKPYEVEVNGVKHRVAPARPVLLTLSEGEIVVRGAPGQKGDLRFTASTPFFSRAFDQHVLVINPDRAAIVYRETAWYYSSKQSPRASTEGDHAYFANEAFYFLPEPDHFFVEFPNSIQMPSDAAPTPKSRVHAFNDLTVLTGALLLKEKLGPEAVRAHLVHQARLNPGKESLQQAIMMILKPDDARKLLETHLADRPVLVDWHRGYQQLMDRNFPQEDTSTRYRQWMEAEPDNGSLIYLYARTLHDRSQSQVLNEKATRAKIPSNYAFYALGTEAFIDGDYTRSLELLDRAEKAGLKSDALRLRQRDAFLALNRIDDVLARTKQRRAAEPLNTTLFVDELMLSQARKPDRIAGQRSIATFITAVRGKLGAADPELDPYLASHLAYSLGDERDAGVSLTKVKGPWHAFEAAVAQRDHVAAARAIKDHPQHISRFQWILMLTAHAAGDEAAAEKYYQSALAELEQEDSYGREIAQLVKTPSAEAAQKIMQHPTFADELRVMLTALGVRMPEQRAALFKRASELDHDPAFPHLLLTSVRQKLASAQ